MNGTTIKKNPSGNFSQLLRERIDKANSRRKLTAMKKKKAKKLKTKKPAPNFYGLGKFNYLIFKFLCSRFKL